jgi:G3E family GTPase
MEKKKTTNESRIPVTVLTGYLGSGKTTLLNYILSQNHGYKIAVIENDFGEVGVDIEILKENITSTSTEQLIEMKNGCICCTVREDLIKILIELAQKKHKFNYVIIKTTGIADPAPIAQTFFIDKFCSKYFYLDAIVTIVDCKHFEQHLDEKKDEGIENEITEQIVLADKIILNKIDLVEKEYIERLKSRIKKINKNVEIILSEKSIVDLSKILKISAFDINTVLSLEPDFLESHEHQHDKSISSIGIVFEGQINKFKLNIFINDLLDKRENDLYKYKAILNIKGSDNKYVFEGIHRNFTENLSSRWEFNEKRVNKLCFIGKNIDKNMIEEEIKQCLEIKELRFKIGREVFCNVGKWEKGIVIRHWDECNAYRVRLDNGNDIWAPADIDLFIKAKR